MKTFLSKISLVTIALLATFSINAQMLNTNKLVDATINYVQFPTEGKIMSKAYVQFTDTQTGAAAMLNRAFQKKMGMAGEANITQSNLSAPIFYSEGDISVVISAREPKLKEIVYFKGSQATIVYGAEHAFSASATPLYAETSFTVYRNGEAIYEHAPVKLAGYKQSAVSSTPQGPAGGDLTSLKAMEASHEIVDFFPHEELALEYVEKILKAKYGMGMGEIKVTPYYVSGLKRENKKKSGEFSEELVEMSNSFQKKMGEENYNTKLNDLISFYKGLEAQKSDNKKAEVNKKNIWQIQSNIAIAYFLMDKPAEAKSYMEKALTNRDATIIKKESANGKAGMSAGIAMNYLKFAPDFIASCDNYIKGLEANPSEFVAQFKDYKSRKVINDKAQDLMLSYELGLSYGLGLPINIYDCNGKNIKKASGTINTDGQEFTYQYNKVWYSFIQKMRKKSIKYVTKVSSTTNPKDKVKVYDYVYYSDWSNDNYIIRPGHWKDQEFKMASSMSFGKFGMFGENTARAITSNLPNRQYEDFVTKKKLNAINRKAQAPAFPMSLISSGNDRIYPKVQFNTNNDIIIAIRNERDKPDFEAGKIDLEKEEVLFYDEIVRVHQFKNGELSTITTNSYSVARDRDAKLPLDAKAWKMSHAGQLLPTTVVSEESHQEKVIINNEEVKVTRDGKSKTIKKSIEKNGDNWTAVSFGDTKITRTVL